MPDLSSIFYTPVREIEKKKGNNMKCAMCGREIKGRDYIRVNVPDQKDIYVHSMPCEWYASEEHVDNGA